MAVEEICVTCGGAHPYYQCLAAGGNTFPEYRDNIQGYVSAAAGNFNQGNLVYRPQGVANQMRSPGFAQPNVQNNQNRFGQPQGFNRTTNFNQEQPYQATQSNQNFHLNELEKIKRINDVSLKAMQNQIDMVKNELRNEMKTFIQTSLSNQTNEIKNMMAFLFLHCPSSSKLARDQTSNPTSSINPTPKGRIHRSSKQKVENSHFEENLTPVDTMTDNRTMAEMLRAPTEGCAEAIIGPPILAKQFELKYRAARQWLEKEPSRSITTWDDLVSKFINEFFPSSRTTNLRNEISNFQQKFDESFHEAWERYKDLLRAIARDVFVPVGKFTFLIDFVVVDYESDPRVPLILGRPFLRTAHALINVYGEEMILCDRDERLTLNMKHDTSSYSNHPYTNSVNLINIFNLSSEDCLEDLVSNKQSGNPTFLLHKEIASPKVIHEFHDSKECTFLSEELPDIDSFNESHSYFDDDPLSGSTTFLANSLLEEFADKLALISYPLDYDDDRVCDIESDIREIEFFLFQGEDSDFKDSTDQSVLTHCDDLFVDPPPEMFTDEQPPDYSFPPRFDVYPDDFSEIESDATFDDDSFNSEGEKIKEAELLIDQLDLPCDILSEYDSFNSQDFSKDDVLFSPDNEDKVFNPGILSHDTSVKIITRVTQEKKLTVSFASWLSEDFDPPFYELLVFKEVPNSMRLLPFSSENKEKVFKPGIYISKKFHCYFLSELPHPGFPVFKVNLIFLSLVKIFHVQNGKTTPLLDVLLFHLYPP
nr:reverse transcriptase domain-containing protein [Tanacetum cinerariifolium]